MAEPPAIDTILEILGQQTPTRWGHAEYEASLARQYARALEAERDTLRQRLSAILSPARTDGARYGREYRRYVRRTRREGGEVLSYPTWLEHTLAQVTQRLTRALDDHDTAPTG